MMTETNVVLVTLLDHGGYAITLRLDNPQQNLSLATIREQLAGLLSAQNQPYGFHSRYHYSYSSVRDAAYQVTTKRSIS